MDLKNIMVGKKKSRHKKTIAKFFISYHKAENINKLILDQKLVGNYKSWGVNQGGKCQVILIYVHFMHTSNFTLKLNNMYDLLLFK